MSQAEVGLMQSKEGPTTPLLSHRKSKNKNDSMVNPDLRVRPGVITEEGEMKIIRNLNS